ncbi:glycosyltransferase family 2 protein [Desulfurivibrio sp. D14AmB]|uniref:glycosyltransferase family 2 protein n=1 Tax=Desulfurivibrio sp. D14AmB TaxID=3374370 RepID=UPI00376EDE50
MRPGYSCIIPTRDRRAMVQEAVATVLAQERPAAEIIVVDDGSRDDTMARLAARFPQIRLVRLDGRGPGPARNAGVAAASAEVLMFLDSDDHWRPDHAGRLLAVLERGFAVAYGPTHNIDQVSGGEFAIPAPGEEIEGDCFAALLRWCFLVPSSVAVTRAAFHRCGGFSSGELGEDWVFFLKLAGIYPFGFAAGPPLTTRRLHRESLCRLVDPDRLIAGLRHLETLFDPESDVGRPLLPPELARRRQARERFAALARWTEARAGAAGWASIQEWYLALRREKMV